MPGECRPQVLEIVIQPTDPSQSINLPRIKVVPPSLQRGNSADFVSEYADFASEYEDFVSEYEELSYWPSVQGGDLPCSVDAPLR
jgi:hypothetical protein